jgi:hypothetical protein
MRTVDMRRQRTPTGVRLSATIEWGPSPERLETYFDFQLPDPTFVSDRVDAFAPAMLVPAMRAGESLNIPQPLSPQLCFQLPRIRDLFHLWYPEFAPIPLNITPRTAEPNLVPRAITCFSGGVDSFYSLLKHRHGAGSLPVPLTHILFMRGVESRQDKMLNVEESEKWTRDVAAVVGVECVFGESNLRMCFEGEAPKVNYEDHYFGSVLAAHALALSPGFGYVCIPSSYSYNHIVAHGSSPVLDEMYSTENVRVVHDGAEVTRPVKVAKIIEWDKNLVLSRLRVCLKNGGAAYNCGKCKKCVRTAVALRVLGVWEQASTFPNKSMDHWPDALRCDHAAMVDENLEFARERGADRKLLSMLEEVVRLRRRNEGFREFVRNTAAAGFLPAIERTRKLFP